MGGEGREAAVGVVAARNDGVVEHGSAEHVAAMAATVVVVAGMIGGARRWGDRWTRRVGRGLAVVMVSAFVAEQVIYAARHQWSAQVNLPLQLSDAVTFVTVAALWHLEWALAVEVVYFWALSASVQAVVTPDLAQSFPDPLYFTYFATHSGAIAAACLLVFGARRAPRPGALWRVYAITAAFTAVAAVATVVTRGNYMFLRRKPVNGSLLDVMGPWPVYIASGAVVAFVIFAALAGLARWCVPVPAARNDSARGRRTAG